MATFKFIGDPRPGHEDEGPGTVHFPEHKLSFPRNVETEVADKAFAKRLRGNSHFEEVGAAPAETAEPAASSSAAEASTQGDDGPPNRRLKKRAEAQG